MLGVYTSGVSGAHLNPAVTLANCVYRQHPWSKFPKYLIAQTLGAFCASGVVYGECHLYLAHSNHSHKAYALQQITNQP